MAAFYGWFRDAPPVVDAGHVIGRKRPAPAPPVGGRVKLARKMVSLNAN